MNTAEKEAAIKVLMQFGPMATIASCIKKIENELTLEYMRQGALRRVGLNQETFKNEVDKIAQAFISKHSIAAPPAGFHEWLSKRLLPVIQYCARNGYTLESTKKEMTRRAQAGDTLIAFKLIFD